MQQNWWVNYPAQFSKFWPLAKLPSSRSYLSTYLRQLSKHFAGGCPATRKSRILPEKGFWHLAPSGGRGETKQNSCWYLSSLAWRLVLASQDKQLKEQVLLCPRAVLPGAGVGGTWTFLHLLLHRPCGQAEITADYKHRSWLVNIAEDAEVIPPSLNSGAHVKLKH